MPPRSRPTSRPTSRRGSIDPELLVRMDRTAPTTGGGETFNVLFVGAGNIMFGSDEGPWNHSFRLEHKLGPRLKVVALVDPAVDRAAIVLQKKRDSFVVSAYEKTRIFRTLKEFADAATPEDAPQAVIVGCPPFFRGTTKPNRDVELQVMKYFPDVPIFVEKPVATGVKEDVQDAFAVAKAIDDSDTICSVGYMLRYLRAVQMIKRTIEENNLTVMATIARYGCAYESISKEDWWDKSKSFGPVIEQATHFCDLSRYFGGEVDISTVVAHSLEWHENAGHLSKMRIDETKIKPENRIPRVTSATWKYESGAVGSLMHVVALQGKNYSCELEVYADGYMFKLVDPYVQPMLIVRSPGSDFEQVHRFENDDPFFSEISNLIDVIEDGPESAEILSTFQDACKTYEFTWAIREASEKSRK